MKNQYENDLLDNLMVPAVVHQIPFLHASEHILELFVCFVNKRYTSENKMCLK